MRIDAVIFDCDGTLVDSEPLMLAVMLEEMVTLGAAPEFAADIVHIEGQRMATSLAALEQLAGMKLPTDFETTVRRKLARVFRERLQPVEGALALVEGLRLPFCVASNGPREKIELGLEVTGLLPHFAGRIYSAYEVGSFKPEPGLFLHAAAALGVDAAHCAVVEDSLPGIRAGLAAGMAVYALRPLAAMPDDIASRVHHLPTLGDLASAPWFAPDSGPAVQ